MGRIYRRSRKGVDRIGAKRRETAAASPKGEQSESIDRNLRLTNSKLPLLQIQTENFIRKN